MATETEEPRTDFDLEEQEEEGGPVKSFLEHLEDLRWVLIKIAAAVGLAMLLCLIAGDKAVAIIMRPLHHADGHQCLAHAHSHQPAAASLRPAQRPLPPLPTGTNQSQWRARARLAQ